MGKVSKRNLPPKIQSQLEGNLWKTVAKLGNAREAKAFLENFFTPSEVTMFAKRLEALKQLTTKRPYAQIARKLKMSSVTLARLNNRLRADPKFRAKIHSQAA